MVVAAVALDEAGPFAVLGEAGLEVGLEGEEGGEGVGDGEGEWLGVVGLCGRHWVCFAFLSVTLSSGAWTCDASHIDALIDNEMPRLFPQVAAHLTLFHFEIPKKRSSRPQPSSPASLTYIPPAAHNDSSQQAPKARRLP